MTNVFDVEDDAETDTVEAFVGDTLHLFEEENPPTAVDELFDDFFYNFMDDARFQGQRIVYPLPCKEDEDEEQLSREDWPDYDHFKNQEVLAVIYEREQDYELAKDTSMQHVGVEWIPLKRGEVENFHFNRVNGQWMLTDIVKRERKSMPNGSFLDFYAQFVADSVFQREALAEPVKVILTSEDGEEEDLPYAEFLIDTSLEMKGLKVLKDSPEVSFSNSSISEPGIIRTSSRSSKMSSPFGMVIWICSVL